MLKTGRELVYKFYFSNSGAITVMTTISDRHLLRDGGWLTQPFLLSFSSITMWGRYNFLGQVRILIARASDSTLSRTRRASPVHTLRADPASPGLAIVTCFAKSTSGRFLCAGDPQRPPTQVWRSPTSAWYCYKRQSKPYTRSLRSS